MLTGTTVKHLNMVQRLSSHRQIIHLESGSTRLKTSAVISGHFLSRLLISTQLIGVECGQVVSSFKACREAFHRLGTLHFPTTQEMLVCKALTEAAEYPTSQLSLWILRMYLDSV